MTGASVVAVLLCVSSPRTPRSDFGKAGYIGIVEGRPFPDTRLFGTEGSGRVDSDNLADKT